MESTRRSAAADRARRRRPRATAAPCSSACRTSPAAPRQAQGRGRADAELPPRAARHPALPQPPEQSVTGVQGRPRAVHRCADTVSPRRRFSVSFEQAGRGHVRCSCSRASIAAPAAAALVISAILRCRPCRRLRNISARATAAARDASLPGTVGIARARRCRATSGCSPATRATSTALIGAGRAALELGDAQAAVGFFGRAEEVNPSAPAAAGRPRRGDGARWATPTARSSISTRRPSATARTPMHDRGRPRAGLAT